MAEIPLLQAIHYYKYIYSIYGCDQYTGVMQYTGAARRLLLPLCVEVAMLKPAKYCGEYHLPRRFRVPSDCIASVSRFHLIYSPLISVSCITIESIPDIISTNLREMLCCNQIRFGKSPKTSSFNVRVTHNFEVISHKKTI